MWQHKSKGQATGPVTHADMILLFRHGDVQRTTLVWKKGFKDWIEASETGLYAKLQVPPPLSSDLEEAFEPAGADTSKSLNRVTQKLTRRALIKW